MDEHDELARRERESSSVIPPSKRQKLSSSLFVVRQRHAKGGALRDIIDIGNIEYVTFNGDKYDYVYYILGLILEVNIKELIIYRCDDGKSCDDSSSKWRQISSKGSILGGFHLVAWKGGIINNINIDPVAYFTGAGMKSLSGTPSTGTPKQKMTTPLLKTPKSKPSSKPQESTKEDRSDEVETICKGNQDLTDVLAKLPEKYFQNSLQDRDKVSCVWGVKGSLCRASHIVPTCLLKVYANRGKVFTTKDGSIYTDLNDPRLGLMLSPDIDIHYNSFTGSISLQDQSSPRWHCFRTTTSSENSDWTYGSWSAQNRRVHVPFDEQMRVLGEWHYKHCVILAWGSPSLKSRTHRSYFHSDEEIEFALDIFYGESQSPATSPLPSSPADYF